MGDAIARHDAAEMALAHQDPAFLEVHRDALPPGTLYEMHVTAQCVVLDPVAQANGRLEQPRLRSEGVIVIAASFQGPGLPSRWHIEPSDRAQHAQMCQHPEDAVARQQDAVGADGTSTAPLATEIWNLTAMSRSCRQPRIRSRRHPNAPGSTKSPHHRFAASVERLVPALIECSEGQVVHRTSPGVEVEPRRVHRHEHAVDVVGDLPGWRRIRRAWKSAIEVAGIERRDAGT